jgi:ATP-dependent DNA ligase
MFPPFTSFIWMIISALIHVLRAFIVLAVNASSLNSKRRQLEGMVTKRSDSVYVSGRTRAWLKIKTSDSWLDVLNNREPNNYRAMVCAFLTSTEYQLRFGTSVTRTNQVCGP